MDFSLNDDQVEIRALAERILRDYCTQERLRIIDETGYFDSTLWAALAEAGLLGIATAEEHGGMGFGFDSLAVLLEQAGRAAAPVPLVPVLVTGLLALTRGAPPSIAAAIAQDVVSGRSFVTAGLHEMGSDDPFHPETRAVSENGVWRLTGVKTAVPAAREADRAWVTAATPEGLGIFLIAFEADGFVVEEQRATTGEIFGRLSLQNVAAEPIALGDEAETFLARALDLSRAAYAALAVGVADHMISLSATYTTERVQFGKPIASFQAVSHALADSVIALDCLRSVVVVSSLAAEGDGSGRHSSALTAKIWAADTLARISQTAQQVHGGMGVDQNYSLWRYAQWARLIELTEGGAEASLDLLATQLFGAEQVDKNRSH